MKSKKIKISYMPLLPLIFFCTIYPLITRLYLYDSGYEKFDWFDFTIQVSDVFLGWKMIAMEATGVIMCLMLVYYVAVKHQKIKLNQLIWMLLGYAFLTLLSTMLSDYSDFGWRGAYEQFEPVWCTMIYVLIVCYIYILINDARQIRVLLIALAVGTLIVGLIGFFQLLSMDIMTSDWIKYIVVPPKYYDVEMNRGVYEGISYMTLYNPNYVGSYVSLLLPLFLSLAMQEDNVKIRILYAADCVMLYASGLGCRSDSARWGMSLGFILVFFMWFRRIGNRRRQVVFAAVCLIAVIGLQYYYMFGVTAVYNETPVLETEQTDDLTVDVAEAETEEIPENVPISENLKAIETGDDALRVDYGSDSFYLSFSFGEDEFTYNLTDETGETISLKQEEGKPLFTITDPRFAGICFYPIAYQDGGYGVQLLIDGKEWNFSSSLEDRPGYYYYNEYGKFDKITTAENYLFENHGRFGSGRGFIWGETLALLKHTLFLGTGADSFALVFPQDNYVQKYLNGYEGMVVSRPHNMYLQIGVQNGVLALLLFLTAVMVCLYKTWKMYKDQTEPTALGLQIGIIVGVIGYLFTGLVNDANICITPIFWCIFGVGNLLAEQKKK